VQWLLDDLDRADDSIKRVDRIVRELIALGQVPKEEKKAAKEEPNKPPKALGNAEVHKVVKEFGLDTNDIDLRVKAMKILNSCPIDQWPKELAKVYGVKESDLKAKLNNVRKLPFVTAPALIDI